MKLTKREEEVFDNIREGISDTSQLRAFTQFDLDQIKEILVRLEDLNLITLERSFDRVYNEDFWNAKLNEGILK